VNFVGAYILCGMLPRGGIQIGSKYVRHPDGQD
jgi:hypothetical protein